jgi:hypothetical protein
MSSLSPHRVTFRRMLLHAKSISTTASISTASEAPLSFVCQLILALITSITAGTNAGGLRTGLLT